LQSPCAPATSVEYLLVADGYLLFGQYRNSPIQPEANQAPGWFEERNTIIALGGPGFSPLTGRDHKATIEIASLDCVRSARARQVNPGAGGQRPRRVIFFSPASGRASAGPRVGANADRGYPLFHLQTSFQVRHLPWAATHTNAWQIHFFTAVRGAAAAG